MGQAEQTVATEQTFVYQHGNQAYETANPIQDCDFLRGLPREVAERLVRMAVRGQERQVDQAKKSTSEEAPSRERSTNAAEKDKRPQRSPHEADRGTGKESSESEASFATMPERLPQFADPYQAAENPDIPTKEAVVRSQPPSDKPALEPSIEVSEELHKSFIHEYAVGGAEKLEAEPLIKADLAPQERVDHSKPSTLQRMTALQQENIARSKEEIVPDTPREMVVPYSLHPSKELVSVGPSAEPESLPDAPLVLVTAIASDAEYNPGPISLERHKADEDGIDDIPVSLAHDEQFAESNIEAASGVAGNNTKLFDIDELKALALAELGIAPLELDSADTSEGENQELPAPLVMDSLLAEIIVSGSPHEIQETALQAIEEAGEPAPILRPLLDQEPEVSVINHADQDQAAQALEEFIEVAKRDVAAADQATNGALKTSLARFLEHTDLERDHQTMLQEFVKAMTEREAEKSDIDYVTSSLGTHEGLRQSLAILKQLQKIKSNLQTALGDLVLRISDVRPQIVQTI